MSLRRGAQEYHGEFQDCFRSSAGLLFRFCRASFPFLPGFFSVFESPKPWTVFRRSVEVEQLPRDFKHSGRGPHAPPGFPIAHQDSQFGESRARELRPRYFGILPDLGVRIVAEVH